MCFTDIYFLQVSSTSTCPSLIQCPLSGNKGRSILKCEAGTEVLIQYMCGNVVVDVAVVDVAVAVDDAAVVGVAVEHSITSL